MTWIIHAVGFLTKPKEKHDGNHLMGGGRGSGFCDAKVKGYGAGGLRSILAKNLWRDIFPNRCSPTNLFLI